MSKRTSDLDGLFGTTKATENGYGTWDVRGLYRADSVKIVASELAKYNLEPVSTEVVRWVVASQQTTMQFLFIYLFIYFVNGNADHHLGTSFFVHKGIISEVKGVGFISDRMSYITRGCWCDIVLSVHAATEDKRDDTKDSFMKNWSEYSISSRTIT
jgi:hypothetical protein